jgi:hypothetical protein
VIKGKGGGKGDQNVDYKYKNLILGLLYGASSPPTYLLEIGGEKGKDIKFKS